MLALTSLTALLLALETDALVRVGGASACPRPDEVEAHLERRLPARPAGVEPDRATVDVDAGQLRLVLVRPDGTLVGEKRLDPKASCVEMAEAVAIVIAIWERPLRAGGVPPPELPADRREEIAAQTEARPERSAPVLADARADAVVEKPAAVDRSEPSPTDAAARPPWRFEIGAGVETVFPGGMPGALIDATLRSRAGFGPRIALGGAWWNEAELGVGHVSWTRLTASLGLIHGWASSRLFLDLREQLVAAALVARGRGYDRTQTRVAFDPGVEAGLRAGVAVSSSLRLWLDVGLAFWPVPQELRVDGFAQSIDAGAFSGLLSVGGTFLTAR
jgi:hypothetical protein